MGALIDILEHNPRTIGNPFQMAVSADLLSKMSSVEKGDVHWYAKMDYKPLMETHIEYEKNNGHCKHNDDMLRRYRRMHNISDEDHLAICKELKYEKPSLL